MGSIPSKSALLSLFTILFAWVSLGFWTALSGFVLLCVGGDRHALSRSASPTTPIPPEARTALVMPIRNEHVARVFAGIRATWESVPATGLRERFDFFVLSDSSEPDTLVAERQAWVDLCTSVNGFGNDLLSLAPAPRQAKERQHRGFLSTLGQPVPVHGRPRRGQRHER